MVETATFTGAPAGMNVALPAHQLADEEARYLQDFLNDVPGILKMRGPVKAASPSVLSLSSAKVLGMGQSVDPAGNVRLAAFSGLNDLSATRLSLYSDDYSAVEHFTWTNLFSSGEYPIVDMKPALGGGAVVGASTGYELADTQTLGLWRGGNKDNYTTGTITATRGSASVTGSGTTWDSTTVSPGMFLLDASDFLIGVVKSVDSTTTLTLEQPAIRSAAATAYTLTSIRGISVRVATGRITCTTTGDSVQGSFTKFKTNGLDSGTWHIFTLPELTFVGTVSTVADDTDLTLTANAAVALDNARYVAIKDEAVASVSNSGKVGFLNAQYAGRQFYANLDEVQDEQTGALSSRVNFSDTLDPEALDLDPAAGDFLDIGSAQDYDSPIMALAPSYNALLFIKENEVFALYGATPGQWTVRKLHDDGTLNGMSVASIDGGIIWAGRRGIYYYDGVEVRNLTEDKLGNWYEKGVSGAFDPTTDRMYSMIDRDHYFLFIDTFSGQDAGIGVTKGATTTYPTRITIVINLRTGAISTTTNLNIRGAVELPAEKGMGVVYAVNSSTTGTFCLARDLFTATGVDTITCDGDTAGPDPYIETKKYDVGDAQRKKLWKQIQLHYKLAGDTMSLDTIVGLNDDGITSSSTFATALSFVNKRIKFLKRSTHMGVRLYCGNQSTATELVMGPWALGFKYQRKGRV